MATPSGIRSGVGFRNAQILAIASDDYPAATQSTVCYAGVNISGAKTLTINDPEPRNIVHTGDDYVFALDVLPPLEPVTGELVVGKINDTLDAILGDDLSVTIGEALFFGIGTDNRGNENQVTLLAFRQALETDPTSSAFGARRWEFRLFPRAILTGRAGSFDENPESKAYTVTPQFCTKYPWGVSFTSGTEGFTRAQVIRGVSEYKPKIVAWNGDNSQKTFSFPTGFNAASTTKVKVWSDGVVKVVTTDYAVTTTQIVFTTAPATNVNVVVWYEYA